MWRHSIFLSAVFALGSGAMFDLNEISDGTICGNNRDGDVVSHPLDCQAYFVCGGQVPIMQYCDGGLHFDAVRSACNWPEQANCNPSLSLVKDEEQKQSQQQQEPQQQQSHSDDRITLRTHSVFIAIDTLSGHVTDPMDKYDPKAIECRHFGAYFLPHPSSCRRYFICAYGHLHRHKCGYGTAWNYKRQECELDYVSECYSRSVMGTDIDAENVDIADENAEALNALLNSEYETSWPRAATTTGPIGASTICIVIDTDTTLGTTTTGTTTESTWHPTGTGETPTGTGTWHPTGSYHTATGTGSTESTWYPTGSYHTATTATTETTSAVAEPSQISGLSADLACPTIGEAYLPNSDNCSKYFICIDGRPVPTICPQGLYWDQKAKFCDLAKNVECYHE